MNLSRREFLQMLAVAGVSGFNLSACAETPIVSGRPSKAPADLYEVPNFGNVSLMHYTDCHAQLTPVYFREPNINLGIGSMRGNAPHLVGDAFLKTFGMPADGIEAHAFTYLNFEEAARTYGKVGGFAHLSTLVKRIRSSRPGSLLLDGGDTWQGSATSLFTNAQDMVDAQKLLGVDIMTPHWEMTYGAERVKEIIEKDFAGHIEFLAQNVVDNEWNEAVFSPYTIREINGVPVAIIGQAFPYTPIANPRYMVPDWSFGIRDDQMQGYVDEVRGKGAQVVVVLSHNGMDVDLKMASRVSGIDAIFGGHTHDAVPKPITVKNPGGKTLVMNSGSNSKFLSVLDLDVRDGKIQDYRYRLLPVFSNLIEPDAEMAAYIEKVRAPFKERLEEPLAISDELLYRRGNFNGTFDQLICDALMQELDAEMAFSPGFRWGTSILPGQTITFEDLMTQTAITYAGVTRSEMSGDQVKIVLEDVADNLFNEDPYYQQGGDMVRVGGLKYAINPKEKIGKRITDMSINGRAIEANKTYSVGGWASVAAPLDSKPVWDVVADYLRAKKTVSIKELNVPTIKGIDNNPGYETM
ncbi:thiosulfohydrolase SoxB [Solemya pervernicosa gill symbiont]|uniref:Thiosulfohydrolase SoxB n=2 Tax=Gammaproteobacteria incertae sedis TaxID=118884 RepID=A0A1T2L380_9GAMM|nr:thiosulfohydrolase SoxB [Candidatus Reidiella endopervernicosa]OOZ39565.1 thiosulfohydrolase SoxB [Solemya pervernicosa gill symbiont]QKQ25661.1 thiosulfohydrolase SoxB [Candidatus Reidiella endopervernicosa]